MQMNFIDFFAGLGGFRLGMEMAGHTCVGWVEIDKFARKSYEAIHDTKGEWTWYDVSTIDYRQLPRADAWTFGFPCQDISIAGDQEGFDGERSSLFFEITKRLRQIKNWCPERMPSYLLIENVKNFLSVNRGWDFLTAQVELDEIGYDAEWDVLNTKNFGLPQNRERVFIVGHLRGRGTRKVFPLSSDGWVLGESCEEKGPISPCLRAKQGGADIEEIYIIEPGRGIRRSTPLERFRLQGIPDQEYQKVREAGLTDTQLYKQAGNGVSIPVVYEIAQRL